MAVLPIVAKFATAGMFDLSQATTLLSQAQSAVGLSSKNATEDMRNMTRVANVLAMANKLADGTIKDFSQALANKGGAAIKVMNKSLEEGVAILALFAKQGVKGLEGGSLLSQMQRYMAESYIRAGKAQKQLGFKIYDDKTGEMRHIADIVKNLEDIMGNVAPESKAAMLKAMGFQARFQAAILPLIGNSKLLREFNDRLDEAGSAVDQIADKQLTSFNAQVKILWNQITILGIEMGQLIAKGLAPVGVAVSGLIKMFMSVDPAVRAWVMGITASVAAVFVASVAYAALAAVVAKTGLSFLGLAAAVVKANLALLASPIGIITAVIVTVTALTLALSGAFKAYGDLTAAQEKYKASSDKMTASHTKRTQKMVEDVNKIAEGGDTTGALDKAEKERARAEHELNSQKERLEALEKRRWWRDAPDPATVLVDWPREVEQAKQMIKVYEDRLAALRETIKSIKEKPAKVDVKLNLEVENYTEALERQAHTFGMTERAAKLYELQLKGATDAQIEEARGLLNLIDRLEEIKKLQKEAEDITEKNRTPFEKYSEQAQKLRMLLGKGLITPETFHRAMESAREELEGVGDEAKKAREEIERFDAALLRSAEAASRFAVYRDRTRFNLAEQFAAQQRIDDARATGVGRGGAAAALPVGKDEAIRQEQAAFWAAKILEFLKEADAKRNGKDPLRLNQLNLGGL
jgi:TP901 family phage tail tape measure protein